HHDPLVPETVSERLGGDLELARVDAEAREGPARPQAAEAIDEGLLGAQGLDRHIGPAFGQSDDLLDHILLAIVDDGARPPAAGHREPRLPEPTAMMRAAPMSFAPAMAQSPMGPGPKTTTASPILTPADSAPENPVVAMSDRSRACSSVMSSGILA